MRILVLLCVGDLAAFCGREARAGLRDVHVLAAKDRLHCGAEIGFRGGGSRLAPGRCGALRRGGRFCGRGLHLHVALDVLDGDVELRELTLDVPD